MFRQARENANYTNGTRTTKYRENCYPCACVAHPSGRSPTASLPQQLHIKIEQELDSSELQHECFDVLYIRGATV